MQKINGAPGAAAGNAVNEVRKVMKHLVVGVLAHVDSGKTTLSEALLYLSLIHISEPTRRS